MNFNHIKGIKNDGYVTADQAKKDPNGIYLDDNDMKLDPSNIRDMEKLTEQLAVFLEYICSEDIQKMEIDDNVEFVKHLQNKFEDFFINYTAIFKLLTDERNRPQREENVSRLLNLIQLMVDIKKGNRDMDKEFDIYREDLNEEYIYPQFGGKENFEKEIARRAKEREAAEKKNKKKNKH